MTRAGSVPLLLLLVAAVDANFVVTILDVLWRVASHWVALVLSLAHKKR